MFEGAIQQRQVHGLQHPVKRIEFFRPDLSPDEVAHQDGGQRHGQQRSGSHRVSLGVSERRKSFPSWPVSANTGRKETVMTSSEKNSAGPTSCALALAACQ